jgi:hypothetical protein
MPDLKVGPTGEGAGDEAATVHTSATVHAVAASRMMRIPEFVRLIISSV